jgi:hypothetical protein
MNSPSESQNAGTQNPGQDGWTTVTKKRPQSSPQNGPPPKKNQGNRKDPQTKIPPLLDMNLEKTYIIKIKSSKQWTSDFEVLMSLNRIFPGMKFQVRHTKEGATLIRTTSEDTRDKILHLEILEMKPVHFELLTAPTRKLRYVITKVPFQIPEKYFEEVHGFSEVRRLMKGDAKTQSLVFTATEKPPSEVSVPYYHIMPIRPYVPDPPQCFRCHKWNHTMKFCKARPRCYHCGKPGPKDAPPHFVCCKKTETPTCINCQGSHNPAYKGCPARIQTVYAIHERMGLEPQRKTPVVPLVATPAPWMTTSKNALDATSLEKDFPALQTTVATPVAPPPKQINIPKKPELPKESHVTATVTAILAHMSHLMKTVDTIKELIKSLPRDLYKKAEQDLKEAQMTVPTDQVLGSVLDNALTKISKTKETPRHHHKAQIKETTKTQRTSKKKTPTQVTSPSSLGISEDSVQTKISS